jgi:hypothetical protein
MPEQGNFFLFRDEKGCETIVNGDRMKYAQLKKEMYPQVTIVFDDESSVKVEMGGESAYTWVHLCHWTGRNLEEFKTAVLTKEP